ncbi:MAG: glycine zipper 2TM domain-containing protein [Pseudomonadota bacterium]|nr:glycine zipper 2TM domain-containing protein [Pseudomonadota bacterium]
MKKLSQNNILPFCLTSLLLIAGCDNSRDSDNESAGRLLGGIAGAAIANDRTDGDPLGTVIGAMAGSYIGGQIGRDIDQSNRERMAIVLEKQPSNKTSKWIDPDTGVVYEMRPAAAYRNKQRICRPFTLKLHDPDGSGADYMHKGIACRGDDGTWEVVK